MRMAILFVWMSLCFFSRAADNIWTNAGGNLAGTWETASRWSQGVCPGTAGQIGDTVVLNVTQPGAVNGTNALTLNNASLASMGLTEMTIRNINGNFPLANRVLVLDLDGTAEAPLNLIIGDPTDNPADAIWLSGVSVALDLNHVNLTVQGKPTTHGINTIRRNEAVTTIKATDSAIAITNPAASKGILFGAANLGGNAATMDMLRGSLTVTNPARNALIQVGSGDADGPTFSGYGRLKLQDTPLIANTLDVQGRSVFSFDNGGAFSGGTSPAPSTLSSFLYVWAGATGVFYSGTINITNISFSYTLAQKAPTLILVTGATVNVASELKLRCSNQESNSPAAFNIAAGTVDVEGDIYLSSGPNRPTNAEMCALNIYNSGVLCAAKSLVIGRAPASMGGRGSATLTVSGGRLEMDGANWTTANILQVGAHAAALTVSDARGNGCYVQTGGTSVVGTVKLLMTMTNFFAHDAAAETFVVRGGRMTIRGPGFQKVIGAGGGGVWRLGDQPGDLDFSGTLAFDPAATIVNQSLLAFGNDLGARSDGLTVANHAVGTLDLSALDGAEALTVANSGLFTAGALYVKKLEGLTPSEALVSLKSSIPIYYDGAWSPALSNMTLNLTGGGKLIPIRKTGAVLVVR